ncbi:MAG: glycoside hydrolase family 65 protein [Bacteroidota bacterium]
MKNYIHPDPWRIIEDGFVPEHNRISESIFSLGNGKMGQRANFEEHYSGDSLPGSYVAGIYYPDKTRVGWWKNGYPEYFAKVLNATNWIGIRIQIDGEELDLAQCTIRAFRRELHMKEGYLRRTATAKTAQGKEIELRSTRFCSLVDDEAGAIRYEIKALNFTGEIRITSLLDADVVNQDANYEEKFWDEVAKGSTGKIATLTARTKKLDFYLCSGMATDVFIDDSAVDPGFRVETQEKYIAHVGSVALKQGQTLRIEKYAANLSSENHPKDKIAAYCQAVVADVHAKGFDQMFQEQSTAWGRKWEQGDIAIEGDVAAQQGIRFNIFQLNQTYSGKDERLNIGPKGFTGEKYGGSTYWDTEAYCLAFYLSTAEPQVPRNLLRYRYKHLQKAIENAEKLGFSDGAALYPMVTMNGEECHNEWEITFEEIHRNGAIAYAIFDYIRYTGEADYLVDYGLEVLIGIARFWTQRVNLSEPKGKWVMLGVTGPNEYENNVNNNWYTNRIAAWCLEYTLKSIAYVRERNPQKLDALLERLKFQDHEPGKWQDIIDNMYYPVEENRNIFLQQDGFMDKDLTRVADLERKHLPLNQNWSWDRILRSPYIKQADVLQGLYFLEHEYDEATIRRNYEFYEPLTVHESSLSPCVHSILAAKIGLEEKAYEFYLRTARLDLDDYNNDTEDGLHITSMAGSWMSIVKGFAGMRVIDGRLNFAPFITANWKSYTFKIGFRGRLLRFKVEKGQVRIENESEVPLDFVVHGREYGIQGHGSLRIELS